MHAFPQSWVLLTALNARPSAPMAELRRTHSKVRRSEAVAQALGHHLGDPNP